MSTRSGFVGQHKNSWPHLAPFRTISPCSGKNANIAYFCLLFSLVGQWALFTQFGPMALVGVPLLLSIGIDRLWMTPVLKNEVGDACTQGALFSFETFTFFCMPSRFSLICVLACLARTLVFFFVSYIAPLGFRRDSKMILSHIPLTSLNMSSYRAIWTYFRQKIICFKKVWASKTWVWVKISWLLTRALSVRQLRRFASSKSLHLLTLL